MALLSRLRQRPVALEGSELAEKAVAVAMKPDSLKELPSGEQARVGELVAALSVGSGYAQKTRFRNAPDVKPQSAAVVAARAHMVLGPSSTLMPVDIAVALQQQGMDMVEPFAPGTPLQPYYGYGRRPRQYNYEVGRNVTTDTRANRIPFSTLEQLYDGYDIARSCTRYSINDLRSMRPRFEAMEGYEENPVKEIAEAKKRLLRPDGKRFLKNWLAMNQLNLWKFDSAPIFRQRDRAGNVTKLRNISAKTIAPMLDYFGDFPEGDAPAFQQFIEGVPWDWLKWSDLIYEPFWPETDSPYGTPPLETVLVNANTDVRLQLYFLQFFTAGSVPEAFAIAPEGMTTGDDIADFEERYYDYFHGDQSERWGLHWLPNGTDLQFYKPQMFDPDLAEYVARRTISAYGLTPQNLGILADVNRATSDTQMDQQFRISTLPIVGYYEDLFDAVLQEDWNLPVQLRFDTGREKEDRLMEAQAHEIWIRNGVESPDEPREKVLGHQINPEEKIPRFIMDQRLGIIPMAHILAISGEVDQLTGAPKPGTVEPQPYELPGGGTPAPGAGPDAQGGQPQTEQWSKPQSAAGAGPKGDPTKAYPRPLALKPAAKSGLPTDGQPDDERPAQPLGSGSPDNATGNVARYGDPGFGMGVAQGSTAQGLAPLVDPEAEEAAEREDLRKWRHQSLGRVGVGKAPRLFEDSAVRPEIRDRVWALLVSAEDRLHVDAAFKGWIEQPRSQRGQWSTQSEIERRDLHRDTDAVIEHFAPLIEQAMAAVIPSESIDQALRDAYAHVAKATQQNQNPNQPPLTPAQQAAVAAGTAGLALPAVGAGVAGASGALSLAVARALLALATIPLKLAILAQVIRLLYAAAYLAGAQAAARASNGALPPWMATLPDTDWQNASEALSLAQGGLAEVLRDADIWIKEMTTTEVNRVGEAIRESVENGRPLSEARSAIDAIVHDPTRALLIAETEYARAQTIAARETYLANGVPYVRWLHQPGACPACMENAAVSPIPITERWPSGDVPVHPRCRCAEAPADGPKRS